MNDVSFSIADLMHAARSLIVIAIAGYMFVFLLVYMMKIRLLKTARLLGIVSFLVCKYLLKCKIQMSQMFWFKFGYCSGSASAITYWGDGALKTTPNNDHLLKSPHLLTATSIYCKEVTMLHFQYNGKQ